MVDWRVDVDVDGGITSLSDNEIDKIGFLYIVILCRSLCRLHTVDRFILSRSIYPSDKTLRSKIYKSAPSYIPTVPESPSPHQTSPPDPPTPSPSSAVRKQRP